LDTTRDAPTIKEELRSAILELVEAYPGDRGNLAQGADPTAVGSSPALGSVLESVRLDGKKVLDLGAGIGDISRAARARGAALVDGFEEDRQLLRAAQLLNAYHGVTRVSFFDKRLADQSSYDEPYDVVIAFSVIDEIEPALDVVARVAEGALLTRLPASATTARDILSEIFPAHTEIISTASNQSCDSQIVLYARSASSLRSLLVQEGRSSHSEAER
jgi:ribosomal protein L11 methylase PrmA